LERNVSRNGFDQAAGADQLARRATTQLGADAASARCGRHTYLDQIGQPDSHLFDGGNGQRLARVASDVDGPPGSSALIGPAAAAAANGPAYVVNGYGLQIDPNAAGELLVKSQPWWKRTVDLTAAAVGLVLLAPLLATVALWIKLVSPGPVFFRQQRIGVGGRPFTMWKFRTIEVSDAAERHSQHVARLMYSGEPAKKLDHELPIIPFGRVLRRFGIDELPQLFNVLRGEMSLVGPRPDVIPYGNYPLWQRRRFDVLPGITGLWQVSGKNNTTFTEMIELDIQYVVRRGVWLDLAILLRTIPAVLKC
jgi:lipopolysaccharide/colanic/teichoic acid biosynthesis glycosyltransferase